MLVNVWWKWTQVYLAMIYAIQISRSSMNLNNRYPSEYVKDFRFLQMYCSYTLETMKQRKGPERRKIAGQLLIDKFQKFMCFPLNKNGTCLVFQHFGSLVSWSTTRQNFRTHMRLFTSFRGQSAFWPLFQTLAMKGIHPDTRPPFSYDLLSNFPVFGYTKCN